MAGSQESMTPPPRLGLLFFVQGPMRGDGAVSQSLITYNKPETSESSVPERSGTCYPLWNIRTLSSAGYNITID